MMERSLNNTTSYMDAGQDTMKVTDDKKQYLTNLQRDWIIVVNYVFLCSLISCLGIAGNIVNVIVFIKQGFQNNTMNISFFALAISDFSSLITLLYFGLLMNPLFMNSDVPLYQKDVQYLTAGWPHVTFSRITGCITVYITAERCLCIMFPLKIKQIITPKRTTFILFLVYTLNIAIIVPTYCALYLDWRFVEEENETLVGLNFRSGYDFPEIENITHLIHSAINFLVFFLVTVLTITLIVKLKEKSEWRRSATSGTRQANAMTNRDRKMVKMILTIASILIVCFMLGVCLSMLTFFEPEVSVNGQYYNLWMVMWSFGFIGDAVNSSVNILIYYNMSSRYSQTLREIFSCCLKPLVSRKQNTSVSPASELSSK